MESPCTPRRGQRQRKPSAKALESLTVSPQKIKKALAETSSDENDLEDEICEEEPRDKPSVLHANEAVEGQKIFTFQARKKRDSLMAKVAQVPKTPHAVRSKIKKKIVAKILEENESSGHDFSDSGSEYEASASQSSESASSDTTCDSSSDHEDTNKSSRPKFTSAAKQSQRKSKRNYTIKTDDYFSNHSTKKILTSNHTLDKLETPRLPQDQLQTLLSKVKISSEHESAIDFLTDTESQADFNKWVYLLHEKFNILLYGLGSKRQIMNNFHQQCLETLPVIVINGFFPAITIKDVLDSIIVDLLELKENPSNFYEACDVIEREFSYIPETHLYLIVHNIDVMRGGKTQSVFARLASVKNIHLIASIDHINAPLIWDHSRLSQFNFSWWDVTSFHPYTAETCFESSMMVQRTGTLALSSLRNVFLSLTTNSKGIYLILVKYQLEHGKNQYYQGLSFKDLYSSCREAFLVSSDLALRAQLTEFIDHKMAKYKRSADGTEFLIIPIANTLLQQFLSEQS